MAALCRGAQVLDVGCAQSMNATLAKGHSVTGLDLAAPTDLVGYDRFLRGNAFDLKALDDGRTYDAVLAGEFIEHVERPYDLLRVLRTALKPGGQLLLSTPNPLGFPVVFAELSGNRSRFYTEDHVFYFTPRWVERMLTRAGFQAPRMHGVGLWPIALPCPAVMSYQIVYETYAVGDS